MEDREHDVRFGEARDDGPAREPFERHAGSSVGYLRRELPFAAGPDLDREHLGAPGGEGRDDTPGRRGRHLTLARAPARENSYSPSQGGVIGGAAGGVAVVVAP